MEVPPISKPMIPLNSPLLFNKNLDVFAYPITPPAGPESMDLAPLKL